MAAIRPKADDDAHKYLDANPEVKERFVYVFAVAQCMLNYVASQPGSAEFCVQPIYFPASRGMGKDVPHLSRRDTFTNQKSMVR
jgi:hypothetical protein